MQRIMKYTFITQVTVQLGLATQSSSAKLKTHAPNSSQQMASLQFELTAATSTRSSCRPMDSTLKFIQLARITPMQRLVNALRSTELLREIRLQARK